MNHGAKGESKPGGRSGSIHTTPHVEDRLRVAGESFNDQIELVDVTRIYSASAVLKIAVIGIGAIGFLANMAYAMWTNNAERVLESWQISIGALVLGAAWAGGPKVIKVIASILDRGIVKVLLEDSKAGVP